MAKFVTKNAKLTLDTNETGDSVGQTDLSDHVQSITLIRSQDTPEATAMGDDDRVRLHGLKEWSMDVTFFQDFDSGSVDSVLWDIINNDKFVWLRMVPDKDLAVSQTNPEYFGKAVLGSHTPLDGAVGDVSTISVTFSSSGALSRNTT